jgi:hypothetical protein
MRPVLFIIFILSLVACGRHSPADKSLIKEFKYSAFLWHLSPDNDSFNFYLAHYIDVNKDGHFKLMRRDSFMSKPHFFEGILSDTLRRLIDTTFVKGSFKTDYNWNVNDGLVYDGFTYCMDVEKPDSINPKKVFFIPNKAPSEINQLATKLDTLIYNIKGKRVDTFNTNLYQEQLKQDYVTEYGQLPKVHREQAKFEPVKIRK